MCRATQIPFDQCMLEKLGVSREFTFYQDKNFPHMQTWPEAIREFASDVKNVLKHKIIKD